MAATIQSRPGNGKFRRLLWMLLTVVVVAIAAFLAGWIPQHNKVLQLQSDLQAFTQDEHQMIRRQHLNQVSNEMNRAYLEATRNNFGLASQRASEAFDHLRDVIASVTDPSEKKALQDIENQRDQVISELAKPDPNVRNVLAGILDKLNQYIG